MALAALPDGFVLRPKLLVGQGLTLTALAFALLAVAASGRARRPWPRVLALALLPAGLALIHGVHTEAASPALARDELLRLLLVPALAAAVGALLARDPAARGRLLAALALGTAWTAGHAVLQRTGGLLPLGVAPRSRAEGGFANPVLLGGWLVLATPPLLLEALTGRGALRWLSAVAAGLALPALLGTKSAGAWAGFGVALFAGLLLGVVEARHRRRLLLGAGVVALAVVVAGGETLLRPRLHTLIWRDTLDMVAEHPGGVGPGQFHLAFPEYASEQLLAAYPRERVIINDAHSELLQLTAELGVAGLGAVLLALLAALLAARRTAARLAADPPPDAPRFAGAVAALLGSLAMSCVSPDLRFGVSTAAFAVLLGLAAAFDAGPPRPLPAPRVTRPLALLLGLALLLHTGFDAQRRLEIVRMARPAPTTPPAPGLARLLPEVRAAVHRAPDDPAAHGALGLLYEQLRRHGEAALAFETALRLAPGDPQLVRRLGINAALAGAWDVAVPHLQSALEHTPDDADLRYLLAFAHYGRGDLLAAVRTVEALLAEHPEHPKARVLLEALRE